MITELRAALTASGARVEDADVDLATAGGPQQLFDRAIAAFGHVDVLVCNHASSGPDGSLANVTAEMLDAHWAVNARSSLLLAKCFAAAHDDARPVGVSCS